EERLRRVGAAGEPAPHAHDRDGLDPGLLDRVELLPELLDHEQRLLDRREGAAVHAAHESSSSSCWSSCRSSASASSSRSVSRLIGPSPSATAALSPLTR